MIAPIGCSQQWIVCAGIVLLGSSLTSHAQQLHELSIDNRVDRFVAFYRDATASPISADQRFSLWQTEDGLAAVPPGPQGDAAARKLLDEAWARYPTLIERIPSLTHDAQTASSAMFAKVNDLLATSAVPIRVRVVLYVGQFDNNAYTMPAMNGKPVTVMLPVENAILSLAVAHEMTHAIHMQLASIHNAFGAPVGETVFLEGLAMRAAQQAVPGLPDSAYTELPGDGGWHRKCSSKRALILKSIAADFNRSGQEVALKYTFGAGNVGIQREAYCAGWFLVGDMLNRGASLADLARIPEDLIVTRVREAYDVHSPLVR